MIRSNLRCQAMGLPCVIFYMYMYIVFVGCIYSDHALYTTIDTIRHTAEIWWCVLLEHCLKAPHSSNKGVFPFIIFSQLRWPLGSNFHRFVILSLCWDTPSEKTGLWQLPKVSSAFKYTLLATISRPIVLISFTKCFLWKQKRSCYRASLHRDIFQVTKSFFNSWTNHFNDQL